MPKPPVAPKPKLAQYNRPGLSPPHPRRDGLPYSSPGSQKKVKPALAPKPCLSKLSTAAEYKPFISKSENQASPLGSPRTVGLLNSQNGIQQRNKKPDWDYIIPICVCSQENCTCISKTNVKKNEKDFQTPIKDRKTVPASRARRDNYQGKDCNVKSQVMNSSSADSHFSNQQPLHEPFSTDRNLNTDSDLSCSEMTVKACLPHRMLDDEVNANVTLQSVPGRRPGDYAIASEETRLPLPKSVPAAPRKPLPIPVLRKAQTSAPAHQEKVEEQREETAIEEGAIEGKMSSDGMGSSSPSVTVPESENKQPVFLSARRACPPPVPPPRKKPFLSHPKKAATSAAHTPQNDVQEEDLGLDSNLYEMEISVDRDDEEIQREGVDDFSHSYSLSQPELNQPFNVAMAAEENAMVNTAPKKPQRQSSPMALMQKKNSLEEKKVENLKYYETSEFHALQDGVLEGRITRVLPSPPNKKSSRNLLTTEKDASSRSSLSKQKAKSFSTADIIRSDGQRTNSFRKLLDSKLALKLPKMSLKGGQSPDSTATGSGDCPEDQDNNQITSENPSAGRKLSCPLIGVEQSVDGDEFSPGFEEDFHSETHHYEDILDYVNVNVGKVGKVGSSPVAFVSQPWQSTPDEDEGIYEEQEPYISLVKNTLQCQTPAECDR